MFLTRVVKATVGFGAGVGAFKTALWQMGVFNTNQMREPVQALEGEDVAAIVEVLKKAGLMDADAPIRKITSPVRGARRARAKGPRAALFSFEPFKEQHGNLSCELRISSARRRNRCGRDQDHRQHRALRFRRIRNPSSEDSRTVATEAMRGGASVLDKICSLACDLAARAPSSPLGIGVGTARRVRREVGEISPTRTTSCQVGADSRSHRHCMSALAFPPPF